MYSSEKCENLQTFVRKNVKFIRLLHHKKCKSWKEASIDKLVEWKNKQNHKPLILNGARQVGTRPISCKNLEKENIKSLHSSVSTEIRSCSRSV